MKHKMRFISSLVVLVVLIGGVLVITTAAQDEEDPIIRIDNFFTTLTDQDLFSGSVLIAQDGEILLSQGYGLANREWNVANTPDTKFRIGSVTKQF